ncbi:hypothetical protein CA234_03070 [Sphingomonas sp. ABOLE]|uniref:hypothetical protein n=1 Tax=Sphingomonas sp. ABOLE TaxID=1985878 RepID=UPI000F7EF343|nr:hypothetical protein [Sphingomonas sp. ABOLE]RSV44411.1 hypothetical protein CA234_03070 [Sphingomonas sp. ABOLE]
MSRIILIAAVTLAGGTVADPFTLASGRELTEEAATSLGLNPKEVKRLVDTGALVQKTVLDASAGGDEVVDGISVLELHDFLTRLGIPWTEAMSIDELLDLSPPVFNGLAIDDMRDLLMAGGIAFEPSDTADQLFERAIAYAPPIDIDGAAAAIESSNNADEIAAALTDLKVPFASSAKKADLARLLAQVRAVTSAA